MSRLKFVASGKTDGVKLPSALTAFTLLVYATAMTAYIYGVEHRPDADYTREEGADELVIFAIVALLHFALGVIVGRRALIAPLLPVLIAIPAGDYPGGWPDIPVWAAVFYGELFFGLPLVALGVAIRWIADRRKQPSSTARPT